MRDAYVKLEAELHPLKQTRAGRCKSEEKGQAGNLRVFSDRLLLMAVSDHALLWDGIPEFVSSPSPWLCWSLWNEQPSQVPSKVMLRAAVGPSNRLYFQIPEVACESLQHCYFGGQSSGPGWVWLQNPTSSCALRFCPMTTNLEMLLTMSDCLCQKTSLCQCRCSSCPSSPHLESGCAARHWI